MDVGKAEPRASAVDQRRVDRAYRFGGLEDRALRLARVSLFVSHYAGCRLPSPMGYRIVRRNMRGPEPDL